jgi:hypothetical protein
MTPRQRFQRVLNFQSPGDRLPMVEWAAWWDETLARWQGEGLPTGLSWEDSVRHFGLDVLHLLRVPTVGRHCPPPAGHGGAIVATAADYDRLRPHLFPREGLADVIRAARDLAPAHRDGQILLRVWLDGFFWFPRTLLGIEHHLLAFYDQPELMHRMNQDLVDFHRQALAALLDVIEPDMIGFAEDMSYNNGPMLSRECFETFLLPYYRQVVPLIHERGIKVLVDSDGQIEPMVPWLEAAGIDGAYPLERQAGVDVVRLRRRYPRFLMLGGYDKMVMTRGEAAMRAEFERLLPVMRSGGFVPSVDHQTPPGVTLEQYWVYIRLFREYVERAARPEPQG